jgi:endonuclease/exonuclease/phosphatase family metal-dependent hydrolase
MRIRVLSYNIHKGFSPFQQKLMLEPIKQSIRETEADLVCLQEVVGQHDTHAIREPEWPKQSQFEFLADQVWNHYSYGRNALYPEGHHGNAILSKFPISSHENEDVSPHRFERRGLLHALIPIPDQKQTLHVFSVHLALFERHRKQQISRLLHRIQKTVPDHEPLIIAGDFNDWPQNVTSTLQTEGGISEAFVMKEGQHARTFPARFPILALDRVYYKNLNCISAHRCHGPLWQSLSDHLPLIVEFELSSGA